MPSSSWAAGLASAGPLMSNRQMQSGVVWNTESSRWTSAGSPPLARINVLREVPDGSGRLFTTEVGSQAFGATSGQLMIWFPEPDRFDLVGQTFQGWAVWRAPQNTPGDMTLIGIFDRGDAIVVKTEDGWRVQHRVVTLQRRDKKDAKVDLK